MADYLEGHLALNDRAVFDAHLDACAECSREIAEMRGTIALLRELPEPQVPGDFAANVMRRIRAGDAERTLLDRIGSFFESITSPGVLAPVSAALLSAGFVLWGQQAGLLDVGAPQPLAETVDMAEAAEMAETAELTRAMKAERVTEGAPTRGATPSASGFANSQLASLGVPASPARGEASVAVQPAPEFHVTISFQAAPPPYQIDAVRPAPVQIPLRADWGAPATGGSVAVAASPGSSLGDVMSRAPSMRVPSSAPPGAFRAISEPRSRDDWLEILEASPHEFAQRLSQLTLAEQELWIDRLARHAAEQGSLDRVVERLRSAGGEQGRLLADDFNAVGASAPQ